MRQNLGILSRDYGPVRWSLVLEVGWPRFSQDRPGITGQLLAIIGALFLALNRG